MTAQTRGQGAVFFDVDGTLGRTTIVHYYAFFRKRFLSPAARPLWQAAFLLKCLGYLALDKLDRGRLNVAFYRNYRGMNADEVKALANDCHEQVVVPRLYPDAIECVARHRSQGAAIVLVTGSLDFLVQPLARQLRVSDVIASHLVESDGFFSGGLSSLPLNDREKSVQIRRYAVEHKIDLSLSHGYGDSISDVPMLESVGIAHVVNPDRPLARLARGRGWPIHRWRLRPYGSSAS